MLIPLFLTASAGSLHGKQKPNDDEVGLYSRGVEIPLNKILLIRKDNQYCALKFIRTWIEMDKERLKTYADLKKGRILDDVDREAAMKKYAYYASYYNKDGSPNFTGKSTQRKEGTASLLPLQGPVRPFVYQPGNGCIECGRLKLLWFYKTAVTFIPLGKSSKMKDYDIELAPTPWTDIKEVNVFDPRVKWLRYNARRKNEFISIDKLWSELYRDHSNDVLVGGNGVEVPLGRILLIRNNSNYCALKFKKYWSNSNGKEIHASYESYYPEEGGEDFTIKMHKATENSVYLMSAQEESNPVKRPDNEQIKCGPTSLYWEGNGFVSFFYNGWDHDYPYFRYPVELAPTPWTDFSQINVHDIRLKWYKNDFNRKNVYVPENKLWEHDK